MSERKKGIFSNEAIHFSWSRNKDLTFFELLLLLISLSALPQLVVLFKSRLQSKKGFLSLIKKYNGIEFNQFVHGNFNIENEINNADIAIVDGAYSIESASIIHNLLIRYRDLN